MDFLTFLRYLLAVVETGALIGAMIFSTRGIRERNDADAKKALLTKAAIFFAVYVVLNMLRLTYFPE